MNAQEPVSGSTVTLAQRLRALRERAGWNQTELGRRAGVDRSIVSRIEAGRTLNPGRDVLVNLATALRVDVSELSGQRPLSRRPPAIEEGVARVPLMELLVQATGGEPSWHDTRANYVTDSWSVRGRPNAFAARVTGRCMEPGISPGDIVLIDPDRRPEVGEMVVVTDRAGGTLVKWFRIDENGEPYLRAADGSEVRPTRAHLEGVVFDIRREPMRDPEVQRPSLRRIADDNPGYRA